MPDKFTTPLTSAEEKQFQKWKAVYAPQDSGFDYDLRGAFLAGVTPDQKSGHWPDTFKKPNHPTFSVESKYAPLAPDRAGRWQGETFIPPNRAMPNELKPYDDAQLKRLFALYQQGKFPAAQLHEYRNQGLINDAAWSGAFVPSMRERGDLDQAAALQRFQSSRPGPVGPTSREQLLGQMLGAPVIAGRVPIPDQGFLPGNRPQSQGGGLGPSPFRGYNR